MRRYQLRHLLCLAALAAIYLVWLRFRILGHPLPSPLRPLPTSSETSRPVDMRTSDVPPDIQLFVIWGGAAHKAREIINDVAKNFDILRITVFHWSPESVVLPNLWRLYSGKGGWERKGMETKVRQCGAGNFIAVVVVDRAPMYQVEHTAHGDDLVSHRMNECKKRYRKWTGGGFRVHGTFDAVEAQHDISLLFHARKEVIFEDYVARGRPDVRAEFLQAAATHALLAPENRHTAFPVDTPHFTRNLTAGFGGFKSCTHMIFVIESVPHTKFSSNDAERKLLSATDCLLWPEEVRLGVRKEFRWAVIAILDGVRAPGHADDVFDIEVAQRTYRFFISLSSGDKRGL